MNKNALSIFNQLRPVSVGFDNVFDHFEKMFEDDYFNAPTVNYPPYNIVKTGENKYDVEVALAEAQAQLGIIPAWAAIFR